MKIRIPKLDILVLIGIIIIANTFRLINTNFLELPNITMYLLILWVFLLFNITKYRIKINSLTLTIVLYIFWVVINTMLNGITQISYAINVSLILFSFLVLFPYRRIKTEEIIIILKIYIFLGVSFSVAVLLINFNLLVSILSLNSYNMKLYHTIIGNKNADAAMLFFSIMSTYIIYKYQVSKLYLFFIVLQITSLVIMFSRTPLFALIGFYLVYVFLYESVRRKAITSICMLLAGFSLSMSSFFMNVIIRPEVGLSSRNLIWDIAIDLSKNNIIKGIGLNNWNNWTNFIGERVFVHNAYLQVLVDLGAIGLFFYLLLLYLVIKTSYKLIITSTRKSEKALTVGIFAANISIIVYSFFENNYIGGYRAIEVNSIIFLSMVLVIKNLQTSIEDDNKKKLYFRKKVKTRQN